MSIEQQPDFRPTGSTPIGRGRSGTVFAIASEDGQDRVWKVFTGSGLANLIVLLLTGAPNPYTWCRSAIACAFHARRILARLTLVWFGERLRLPQTIRYGFDEQHLAFALETERIRGRHVALRHPGPDCQDWELRELRRRILPRLQGKLRVAGFDGLLWQAGLGNPVALNNFMIERPDSGGHRWVWIDLESGVPALFPANPLTLLKWYLPKSIHHRQPLFDHVDVEKLEQYLQRSRRCIEGRIGPEEFAELLRDVRQLRRHSHAWRSLPRMRRGLTHARVKQQLSAAQVRYYRRHSLQWTGWVIGHATSDFFSGVRRRLGRLLRRITHFPVRTVLRLLGRFARSHRFRARLARLLIMLRIRAWVQRGQLTAEEAAPFRAELRRESATTYLADFAVHLALKPLARLTTYVIVPAIILLDGDSSASDAALILVSMFLAGPTYRTLYTAGRVLLAFLRGEERPWVALFVGVLPILGTGAYPMQFLYASGAGRRPLPQFIICDAGGWLGERIPIWGGADTLTEHLGNRFGAWVSGMDRKVE